ncbi:hypothetical protein [Mycolicibacterium vanbaalenii]|uniref:Uncharacterized protein n=1 Tax=Mycolicibacterium vanbaalenii (strain DSM 7251 / JCM 13017 / BCRC 16820 / KCTC 9966 / NRRL B-24157 / PYR-1) TaxID=350058 RepID=A1T7P6_MYCVP|nr:hypothetical protein [Mycolicibacterium vanbaalenii]ABM13196.1 conserved hypothetical protein [Mycolicibacterium vanbaalenii PYR-1]MCV7126855.1 hypothetical protein [Mycolicibacterium vanbaalenii PYR-1]
MKLLDEVLAAYGGTDRWRQIETIAIHQNVGGVLWSLKNVDGILDDSTVEIRVQEQRAWHRPLPEPGMRSEYTPDRVGIQSDDGAHREVQTLSDPRASFAGHTLTTPWSPLQLAYFAGYAMWTYLSEPYSLTFPGVYTEELGEWREDGQTWRRLGVRYPDTIATHSADQVLYVDSDGLLRRRDYQVDIAGGTPAAHYMDGHREYDGIVLPVTRVVHGRDDDGRKVPEPITVSIDIDDVRVR